MDQSLVYLDVDSNLKVSGILKELLKNNIDGVICMDDSIAGEVIARCRDAHLRIPDDIRVASFYNSSLLDSVNPSVTSLNFNDRNLGAVAARTLLSMIDGEKAENQVLKNYEVILKESTK